MSGPQDMMMMGGSSGGGGGGGGGATPAGGAAAKAMHAVIPTNPAVNNLSNARKSSFWKRFPKVIIWTVGPLFVMGFIAGAFIVAAVRNPILLIVVASLLALVLLLLTWNSCWGHRSVTGFITSYPVSELATAKDGQFVKVTGVSSIFPSVCIEFFLCKSFFAHHLLTQGVLLATFLKVESWGQRSFPVTLIVSIAAIKRNFWNCAKV
jgi:hypothetical protein